MSSPILVTKLFIPATRPELVPRPRLLELINEELLQNQGFGRKLSLISAPAGFGKTTLVTDWLQTIGEEESTPINVAWLSLDEADNDPVRFVTYFIAALNQIDAVGVTFGAESLILLQSPQPLPAEVILTSLINEIAGVTGMASPDKIILVLDDYHLIDTPPIQEIISFLLENQPPQLHLVIVSREDPLLPISRLRARGQLTEIRAADLRFTTSEAAEFLNQVMGLSLSDEDVIALESRTEGWIAGLQLAALSMQGRDDATTFIQSFTGSHRLVLDYLIEEVLNQQPEDVQNFLLQTAILDQLTGPLCHVVRFGSAKPSGISEEVINGQATLENLDHANLFIVPLDNERLWYRYHHLFAELLEQRLRLKYPDLIHVLHARAVTWYEANGFLSQAIQHAFAGDDVQTAVRLIEKGALDALERSDFGFILNAVERIPETVLKRSPWLFVYLSWALFLTGHIDIAAERFKNTDWLLESLSSDDEVQVRKMNGYIAGLKVQLTAWQRDYVNIESYNDQAKTYLPDHHWIRGYCAMMMGVRYWDAGDLTAAIKSFKEAAAVGTASRNRRVAVTGAIYLGHALELEGHLQQAVQVFQDAFQFTKQDGRELPVACYLHIDLARILFERNDLELAKQHLTKGIQQSQLLADDRIEDIAHGLLTRVYLATEDFENAETSIRNAQKFVPSQGIVYDMRGGEYPEVRLWLKQNNFHEIKRWLEENAAIVGSSEYFKMRLSDTMYARANIALARANPDRHRYLTQVKDILAELFEMADSNGWGSKVIEILILQSLGFDLAGDRKSAMTALERALILAEPEGFVRIFIDEGPPMAHLLYEILSRAETLFPKISTTYVQHLLTAFPDIEVEQPKSAGVHISGDEWIEPLTERELEVLQLIAKGLTNQEIASKLYLSLNTVKAHTRSIYGKFSVNSRTQAIARARSLGILPSS